MTVFKKKIPDPYILGFALVSLSAFVLTALGYGTDFFPFAPMHSDANGYYMYLPALFVYHDPGIHFLGQLAPDPSGFENIFFLMPTGWYVDKYTMGVAILQAPFFLVSHLVTVLFAPNQADGYSAFYQLGNIASGCFYYYLGSYCIYRTGQKTLSKKALFLAVMAVTFGTGLFHYMTRDGGYSHVYSYACIALFMLLIQRFEKKPSFRLQLLGGVVFGMLTLVRVTNAIMVLLYVLCSVDSVSDMTARLKRILLPQNWLGIAAGMFAVWVPQLLWWKAATGHFFVNSYRLPGNAFEERFYWTSPKLIKVLFAVNRGVFFWCPVLVLSVIGFILCRRLLKEFRIGSILVCCLFTYITASWWAFDGFCGFTNRFFVDLSAVVILPMAALFDFCKQRKMIRRVLSVYGVLCVAWTMLFMVEYWFRETTILDVHWDDIVSVFSWYLNLLR